MKYQEACFSQLDVMAGRTDKNPVAAAKGACHAFSIHWLRLVLSNSRELPRDRMAEIKRDCGGVNLLMQNVYFSRFSPHDPIEADQMLFRLRGLTSLPPVIRFGPYSCKELFSNIVSKKGGYIYTFSRDFKDCEVDQIVHTIAFYRTSVGFEGFIYVYDPNRGEFHVLPEDFSTFWSEFVAEYSFISGHLLRQVVVSDKDNLGKR